MGGLTRPCFLKKVNPIPNLMAKDNSKYDRILAAASFAAAVVLAFVSMALHPEHDIAAGVCMVIAQFLLLTASIIGIDYKINRYGESRRPS